MFIKVMPTYCKVLSNDKKELLWLRELLTTDVPGAKYSKIYRQKRWDGKKRFFSWVPKLFPTGLLDFVLVNRGKVNIQIEDVRETIPFDDKIPKLSLKLRDYQEDAIKICLKKKNCIIQAATNAGKTAIFAGLIKKMYPTKTLILIHREELLWQLKEMIEEYTGLEIGVITSKDVLIKPTTIAMVATLVNRIGADQEITDFFNATKCIITDEVHHASNKTISGLLSAAQAVYRFGFSGTIPEEGTLQGMLVRQWIGDVALRISNDELIEQGISAKPHIYMYEIDSANRLRGVFDKAKENLIEKNPHYTSQGLMKEVYRISMDEGIIENEERNSKVVEILKKHEGKSVLIVVDTLKHGPNVETILKENGMNSVFISGKSEVRQSALKLFKEGKLKVLISTHIVDEGLDISRIEVLVLLAGKKSRRQLLQRVGRSLRRKKGENVVSIYDFFDFGSNYLEKHSKQRLKIYNDEKFDVTFL